MVGVGSCQSPQSSLSWRRNSAWVVTVDTDARSVDVVVEDEGVAMASETAAVAVATGEEVEAVINAAPTVHLIINHRLPVLWTDDMAVCFLHSKLVVFTGVCETGHPWLTLCPKVYPQNMYELIALQLYISLSLLDKLIHWNDMFFH